MTQPPPEFRGDIRDPAAGCWHITHDYSNSDPHHCRKPCVIGTRYCEQHQRKKLLGDIHQSATMQRENT